MKLKDKVAVITGGTKGIGFGTAKTMLSHGSKVVIAAEDDERGREAEGELKEFGGDVLFIRCDVRSQSDIEDMVSSTMDYHGRIDCLINNAGWHPPAMTIQETAIEDFEDLIKLNLTSAFICSKLCISHLLDSKGSIINMSSEVGLIGQEAAPAYVATKSGLIGLTRALALDLAPKGVRANAIAPAGVMTPLMREWADSQYDPTAALKMVDSWHPLGRMARIDEIGEVCAFLASDESSFITGQVICPDGGAALGYRR